MLGHYALGSEPLGGFGEDVVYAVSMGTGVFVLSAPSISLRRFLLVLDAGSFSLTGASIDLRNINTVGTFLAGSFIATGNDAGFLVRFSRVSVSVRAVAPSIRAR
jgi:hypothetical protein